MNSRHFLPLVAGACLAGLSLLRADEILPFEMAKQYSSDLVMNTQDGRVMTNKIYTDGGKVRMEVNSGGMQIVSIMRPDQQKMYSVMVAQKMVMEMPYDPEKFKQQAAAAAGPQGKFELVGPDAVDGVPCTKYKVTSTDGKVTFFWIDPAQKHPLKMAAEDGSFSMQWKNFQSGPQDAALFEPPADYQKMTMPALPSMPGGAPGAAPGAGQ